MTGREGSCVASSWLPVLFWAVCKASQSSWSLVSVVPKALVQFSALLYRSEEGPLPVSPLGSHLIGQHQSLIWVQMPAPSWLSLFPGSTPGCSTEDLGVGGLIESETLAGSGSAFLALVIYRTAIRVAQSAATTRALSLV